MKTKYEQFSGIDTGMIDADNEPIHEGDQLVMGERVQLTAPNHPPKTGKISWQKGKHGKVVYSDGCFHFAVSKRVHTPLTSAIVRHLGLRKATELIAVEEEADIFDAIIDE